MSSSTAVTFGRYQAISTGHVDTIETILGTCPQVVIGVLDLDVDHSRPRYADFVDDPDGLGEFYRLCDANCAAVKNVLTVTERVFVWRSVITRLGLADRVQLAVVPRPELAPALFNALYPPNDFQLVFPESQSPPPFERLRHSAFRRILHRAVYSVHPRVEVHTSQIRELASTGRDWQHLMAPGAIDALSNLNRLDTITQGA